MFPSSGSFLYNKYPLTDTALLKACRNLLPCSVTNTILTNDQGQIEHIICYHVQVISIGGLAPLKLIQLYSVCIFIYIEILKNGLLLAQSKSVKN